MIIACLGDSLTEGDYGVFGKTCIANIQERNYPYFLGKLLGAEVRNFGRCGYNASSYLAYYKEGKVNLDNTDAIIIMLGTNGGLDLAEDTQGNKDYKSLIELCKADAAKAKIVLCTPPHATDDPQWSNYGCAKQVKRAVDFVRDFAKSEGLNMIDVAKCPLLTAGNEEIMQPNDGLHYGEVGYWTMANYIAAGLKKILGI